MVMAFIGLNTLYQSFCSKLWTRTGVSHFGLECRLFQFCDNRVSIPKSISRYPTEAEYLTDASSSSMLQSNTSPKIVIVWCSM